MIEIMEYDSLLKIVLDRRAIGCPQNGPSLPAYANPTDGSVMLRVSPDILPMNICRWNPPDMLTTNAAGLIFQNKQHLAQGFKRINGIREVDQIKREVRL